MKTQLLAALAAVPMIAGAADHASSLAPGTVEVTGITLLDARKGSTRSRSNGATASADETSLSVLAGAQYYLLANLAVGLHLGLGYTSADLEGTSFTTLDRSVGPLVTVSFPVAPELALFGSADGSWIHGSASTSGNTSDTTDGYGFGLQAGLKYFPARPVSLDAGLGWSWQRIELEDPFLVPAPRKITMTSSHLGLHLGVSVYFGGGR